METSDAVHSRFETAHTDLTPFQVTTGLPFVGSFTPVRRRAGPSTDADGTHECLTVSP
ncbi:hypothetical protein [Natronorubrum texcoconense]|uniref:Uncharacterized protein n=1 Tax=Natronorubrum texcoconense TaxID=1095776 RepID=A0A1G9FS84_9EURY|nr:hypothetical protein [Natronorubrum texcoconense]SDK91274.1 hypothetical protein SAMN04515672_4265 [Natronorubrum texcoconense]